jgi:hypothetical protein
LGIEDDVIAGYVDREELQRSFGNAVSTTKGRSERRVITLSKKALGFRSDQLNLIETMATDKV